MTFVGDSMEVSLSLFHFRLESFAPDATERWTTNIQRNLVLEENEASGLSHDQKQRVIEIVSAMTKVKEQFETKVNVNDYFVESRKTPEFIHVEYSASVFMAAHSMNA